MNNRIYTDRAAPCVNIEQWQSSDNEASWQFGVEHDSPAVEGHYPDYPILPGVFIFELCCQGIEHYFKQRGKAAKIDCVSSMKFLDAFTPGSTVKIKAAITEADSTGEANVKFAIHHDEKKAAVAKMVFKVGELSC